MKTLISLLICVGLFTANTLASDWNCSKTEAINAFKEKTLINEYQYFKNDPYKNQTVESLKQINITLSDRRLVCAIKYQDATKKSYSIKTFPSAESATNDGHIVTHQGPCGACSNTNDLSVYLSTDLTAPARKYQIVFGYSVEVFN